MFTGTSGVDMKCTASLFSSYWQTLSYTQHANTYSFRWSMENTCSLRAIFRDKFGLAWNTGFRIALREWNLVQRYRIGDFLKWHLSPFRVIVRECVLVILESMSRWWGRCSPTDGAILPGRYKPDPRQRHRPGPGRHSPGPPCLLYTQQCVEYENTVSRDVWQDFVYAQRAMSTQRRWWKINCRHRIRDWSRSETGLQIFS